MSLLRPVLNHLPKRPIPTSISISASQSTLLTPTRTFHAPSPLLAQPRRSPRVRPPSQNPRSTTIPRHRNAPPDIESSLPSIPLLSDAQGGEAVDSSPFLQAFVRENASGLKRSGWEAKLCAEYQITPLNLFQLSSALITPSRNPSTPIQPTHLPLAKLLMTTACTLGNKEATIAIIHTALTSSKPISPVSPPYQTLLHLSDSGDLQAMTLLGLVLLQQPSPSKSQYQTQIKIKPQSQPQSLNLHNAEEALSLFLAAIGWTIANPKTIAEQNATKPPPQPEQNLSFDGANECLVNIGKILTLPSLPHFQDPIFRAQAREAFRLAAIELDDSEAYLHLAKMEMEDQDQAQNQSGNENENENESQAQTEDEKKKTLELSKQADFHLDKALASGNEEAWAVMVRWSSRFLSSSSSSSPSAKNKNAPSMAQEWVLFGQEWSSIEESQGRGDPLR